MHVSEFGRRPDAVPPEHLPRLVRRDFESLGRGKPLVCVAHSPIRELVDRNGLGNEPGDDPSPRVEIEVGMRPRDIVLAVEDEPDPVGEPGLKLTALEPSNPNGIVR
jgi:hypothetical protein